MQFTLATIAALAGLVAAAPIPASSNAAITGSGVLINNIGTLTTEYCAFENSDNGNGWAVPNFDTPSQCITLAPGKSQFMALPTTYKGRIQRTKHFQATWAEFQLSASDDGKAHGDISIEQASDGPVTIKSTDGTNQVAGFTKELVPSAPGGTTTTREADGQVVLDTTMGNWLGGANNAAAEYARTMIDESKTYIQGGTGVTDVSSANNALEFTFY